MAIDLVEKTVRKSKGMHQIGFFSACGGLPFNIIHTHVTTNISEINNSMRAVLTVRESAIPSLISIFSNP